MAKQKLSGKSFSSKEYLALFENLSASSASGDLLLGLKFCFLKKKGAQVAFVPKVDDAIR